MEIMDIVRIVVEIVDITLMIVVMMALMEDMATQERTPPIHGNGFV